MHLHLRLVVYKLEVEDFAGKKKVYTTTVEPSLFFSGSEASLDYTRLCGPMLNTFFTCFPKEMVHTIVFSAGDRPREEECHGGGGIFFSPALCREVHFLSSHCILIWLVFVPLLASEVLTVLLGFP